MDNTIRNSSEQMRHFQKMIEPIHDTVKQFQEHLEPVHNSIKQLVLPHLRNMATYSEFLRPHIITAQSELFRLNGTINQLVTPLVKQIELHRNAVLGLERYTFQVNPFFVHLKPAIYVDENSTIDALTKNVVTSKTTAEAYSKLEKLQMAISTIFPQILFLRPVISHMMQRLKKQLTWGNVVKAYRFLMDIIRIYQTLQGDPQIGGNEVPNATTEIKSPD